jgi:hypothetical protein
VNDLDLSVGQEVAKITAQTQKPQKLTDGTATKLLVGTKIFEPTKKRGTILIAVIDGQQIKYLGLVEG